MRYFLVLAIVATFFKVENLSSCTAFCLKTDNQILVGKNLDWPVGAGFVIINKKGLNKSALVDRTEQPVNWTVKYGSVTFNQLGIEFPLGGMNEAGLVVEELSYSPSVYPASDGLPCLNELQWIQYQLDNYRSVEEVIDNLNKVSVSKLMFGLHYFITDRSGVSAVVEFLNGKALYVTGDNLPVPVLSNNSYQNSLKYLAMHQGFGGEMIPRDGPESQSRFVRAAIMLKNVDQDDKQTSTDYGLAILDRIRQDDTQWQIIYNPLDLTIVFRTDKTPDLQQLELSGIDFSTSKKSAFFELGQESLFKNLTSCFTEISADQNQALLKRVLNQLVELEEIDKNAAFQLIETFRQYYNKNTINY